jgi:hypothetical protein
MDAAADYAAAVRLLKAPLPAYVSYAERSYAGAGTFTKDVKQIIVVRTLDGAVVKGKPDAIQVSTGHDERVNPVSHPPFDATCYAARAASAAQWDGREVEAIDLRDMCRAKDDSETDFQTLYLDPVTHQPLAAVGENGDEHVTVTVEERLATFAGHALPTHLTVHLVGHGIVGFLDVHAGQDYSDYHFSDTMP